MAFGFVILADVEAEESRNKEKTRCSFRETSLVTFKLNTPHPSFSRLTVPSFSHPGTFPWNATSHVPANLIRFLDPGDGDPEAGRGASHLKQG